MGDRLEHIKATHYEAAAELGTPQAAVDREAWLIAELEQARQRIAELEAFHRKMELAALDRAAEEASEHHCGVGFKPNFCDCKYEIAAAIRKLKEPSDGG